MPSRGVPQASVHHVDGGAANGDAVGDDESQLGVLLDLRPGSGRLANVQLVGPKVADEDDLNARHTD